MFGTSPCWRPGSTAGLAALVVMAEGRVVEQGDPQIVLTNPQHPATRQLLRQKNSRNGGKKS